MLGPVAVVAVLAGCASPPPEPPPSAVAEAAPVPRVQEVEPSPFGRPKPLPIDAAPLDPAAVPGCGGDCAVAFDIALPDGGRFAGVQAADGPGALLVRRTAEGEVLTAEPVPDASVTQGVCGAQRCVAVFGTGADAVEAVVADVDDLTVTGRAGGSTSGARPIDLDGDDRVDLALQQSAAAATYWQTWRQTPDGNLEPTGCGPVTNAEQPPTELQTGPCPPA